MFVLLAFSNLCCCKLMPRFIHLTCDSTGVDFNNCHLYAINRHHSRTQNQSVFSLWFAWLALCWTRSIKSPTPHILIRDFLRELMGDHTVGTIPEQNKKKKTKEFFKAPTLITYRSRCSFLLAMLSSSHSIRPVTSLCDAWLETFFLSIWNLNNSTNRRRHHNQKVLAIGFRMW